MTDEKLGLWANYLRIQEAIRIAPPAEIDGLEAQLDLLLDRIRSGLSAPAADLRRAKNSYDRGLRRRKALLRRFPDDATFSGGCPNVENAVSATRTLRRLVNLLSPSETAFLAKAVADNSCGIPANAANRTRLCRLRKKIASLR
jgi:hypothetical protein